MTDDYTASRKRELEPPGGRSTVFELEVISGPDRGKRHEIEGSTGPRVFLGKSDISDFVLTDPLVSRRHAAIEPMGRRLRLVDLDSTNGTVVNGLAVTDAFLKGGETIVLGDTIVSVLAKKGPYELPSPQRESFGRVVGASPEMRKLYPLLERLARSDVPVILEGETGTGKEVVAESLHEASARRNGPFVVFDCTAVPPSLMESALFGHEKGSFTGAAATRHGVFAQANDGTLLIDEIGDLEIGLQAKLLRVIQRSEVQRIGSNHWIKANVRILCATRRDLEREIQAGRFRDDLYYRLAVARVELPALRKRQGDLALLARHFWAELKGDPAELTPELLARLESYSWPGNIRELQNAVAHRIALGDLADLDSLRRDESPTESPSHTELPQASGADVITRVIADELPFMRARGLVLGEFERRYCEWALEKHGGNITRASAASGIARRYFYTLRARSSGAT